MLGVSILGTPGLAQAGDSDDRLQGASDAELIAQADDTDSLLQNGGLGSGSGDDSLLQQDDGGGGQSGGSNDSLLSDGGDDSDGGDSLLDGGSDGGDGGDSLLSGGEQEGGGDLLEESGEQETGDLLGGEDDAETEKVEDGDDDGETPSEEKTAFEMHKEAYEDAGQRYPSSQKCATCHPRQYRQWSVSQHAYAQLSPVYMAMQMTMNAKTAGTVGDFCIRCHNPVGMNLGESVYTSNLDRYSTSREGITCVVCHRIKKPYGEVSGRLPLAEGDLVAPVYGPSGNEELQRVLDSPEFRVVTDPDEPGREIHKEAKQFFQMTESGFCATCHDVTLPNGFRLEEAFAEYHQSPASSKGKSCQDCHMGKEQGVVSGYDRGPAAVVGGEPTRPRKLTNHYFAGPDYPIIHPGLFPHNVEAQELKTLRQWLKFDYEAGWGTDEFEQGVSLDKEFPEAWFAPADRYDARDILKDQFEKLDWARKERLEALRNGYGMSDIRVVEADGDDGLAFEIDVRNKTDGHALPTGFDAERLFFMQVEVRDADGDLVFQSGDRDPNGDVRDSHSLYVHAGKLPLDEQLFTLQSRFLVRLERGGEREEVLTLNHNVSPQPFVRPSTRATTIYGRPRGARKHKRSIPPEGEKTARYEVDADALTGDGPYSIEARFIAQMVPVNLVAKIKDVGFDYEMSPKEIADRVVEGAMTLYEKETEIEIGGEQGQQTASAQ